MTSSLSARESALHVLIARRGRTDQDGDRQETQSSNRAWQYFARKVHFILLPDPLLPEEDATWPCGGQLGLLRAAEFGVTPLEFSTAAEVVSIADGLPKTTKCVARLNSG